MSEGPLNLRVSKISWYRLSSWLEGSNLQVDYLSAGAFWSKMFSRVTPANCSYSFDLYTRKVIKVSLNLAKFRIQFLEFLRKDAGILFKGDAPR